MQAATRLAKREVEKLAKTLGADIRPDRVGITYEVEVRAPDGKVWACDGEIHALVTSGYGSWDGQYEDLLSRMAYGIADCPLGDDCDWCNPWEPSDPVEASS